jgi:hypothetical protein
MYLHIHDCICIGSYENITQNININCFTVIKYIIVNRDCFLRDIISTQ